MLSRESLKRFICSHKLVEGIVSPIYFSLKSIKRIIYQMISLIFFLKPINKNKIIVCNYYGKGYGDNGKYIVEEIINRELPYDIVWMVGKSLNDGVSIPKEVKIVEYGSFKALYEIATSKIWIDNSRKEFYPVKRKKQFYIQTWHGGLGIKQIEGDVEESLSSAYIKIAKHDSKMADLFISNSTHLTNIYKRAFWYQGEILECGYPKNDIFFRENSEYKIKIRDYYKLHHDTRIVLYAPTFRSNNDLTPYDIDYSLLLKTLEEKTNNSWIVLVRLHPNLINYDNNIQYSDKVINATHYPDMQELVIGCDALISDYSSCMFDSEMMKIPTFIYASDLSDYMKDRGSYFRFDELPFPIATNNEELMKNIINFNQRDYEKDVYRFNLKVGLKDKGDAAKQIVDVIANICSEK